METIKSHQLRMLVVISHGQEEGKGYPLDYAALAQAVWPTQDRPARFAKLKEAGDAARAQGELQLLAMEGLVEVEETPEGQQVARVTNQGRKVMDDVFGG